MAWVNLDLAANWSVSANYPPARVKDVTVLTNTAELEGYLTYSGTSWTNVPITVAGSMPSNTYDSGTPHTIGGRCYGSTSSFLGACEVLIETTGTLSVGGAMPTSTVYLFFGDVYPTA